MTGSLRLRPGTRDVWELRVNLGADPTTGQRRTKTRTYKGGKREAQRELAAFVTAATEGRHLGSATTLAELLRRYLDHIAPNRSPSTMVGYRRRVTRRITPALGKRRLSKLRAVHLDDYYRALTAAGRAPSDVRQDHAIIRGALGQAMKWDLVNENVALKATPPKLDHRDMRPPTPDVMLHLIGLAETGTGHPNSPGNPDLACFLRVLAATGARRGEVCGVQIGDFDPQQATLSISRNVVEDGRKLVVKDTKSDNGRRKVNLDPVTADRLRERIARAAKTAADCGCDLEPWSFLFSAEPDGTVPWRPEYVSLAFRRLCDRTGARVRLHDMRHAQATYLLAGGMPVRDVAGRLGQDPATTMRIYAHLLEGGDKAASELMGRLLAIGGGGVEPDTTATGQPGG